MVSAAGNLDGLWLERCDAKLLADHRGLVRLRIAGESLDHQVASSGDMPPAGRSAQARAFRTRGRWPSR